jgi:uridine kinase
LVLDLGDLKDEITACEARVVAIDGRGGSGKSTLARQLAQALPHAVLIEMDDFYRPSRDRVQRPDVHGANYDLDRLASSVLEPLCDARAARYQRYDWDEDRLAEWHEVPAGALALLEGVYSTSQPLRGYADYKIWVDCPYDVRLRRGVERDGQAMREVWVQEWMPAEDRYLEAEMPDKLADLVLDGSGKGAEGVMFSVLSKRCI